MAPSQLEEYYSRLRMHHALLYQQHLASLTMAGDTPTTHQIPHLEHQLQAEDINSNEAGNNMHPTITHHGLQTS